MRLATLRFIFGSVILLLVDILWVASSEITEYLYHEKNFNKPFFTAYCKSVMFVIYLFGFIFCDSWWTNKCSSNRVADYYSSINDSDQQNLTLDDDEDDDVEDEEEEEEDGECCENGIKLSNNFGDQNNSSSKENVSINCDIDDVELVKSPTSTVSSFISESIWIPMRHNSDTSSLSGKSETEDEESINSGDGLVTFISNGDNLIADDSKIFLIGESNVNFKKKNKKSRRKQKRDLLEKSSSNGIDVKVKPKRTVRFSKLIEVRQLSDKHAEDAFLSRLSYSTFMRVIYQRSQRNMNSDFNSRHNLLNNEFFYRGPKLSVKETALLAFYFTSIWFAANLSFHLGLEYSEAGFVNVLSSTTPLFTLLLGIIFPSFSNSDSLSLTKLLGVLICISSVAVISSSEPTNHHHVSTVKTKQLTESAIPLGGIWSLCGAFFYALYIVLMKYNVAHDSMINFPMFFGFIGLFSMILMWPIILLLNFTQLELFDWPNKEQWILILVNGFCGTVISELLWLWGSFMTSSLVGTIAVSFTIPFSVFFDVYFKGIEYPSVFFLGTIPMIFSFITIIFVSQFDNFDPVLAIFEKLIYNVRNFFNDPVLFPDSLASRDDSGRSYEPCEPTLADQSANTEPEDETKNNSKFYHRFLPSGESETPTVATINNRRFEGNSKKSKDSSPGSSALSSNRNYGFNNRFEDEEHEQSQALMESDENSYA